MFDDSNLWCDDCEHSNTGECNRHGALLVVPDSPVVSRARQSLPSVLELKKTKDGKQGLSVFSRERINRRTRFGPLQAPRTARGAPGAAERGTLQFKLFGTGKEPVWFNTDAGNEDRSNWMVFVAVARIPSEQNLVAFQYQAGIYFVTIKDIAAGEELRVWYAKEYAACMGTAPLAKTADSPWSEWPPSSRQLRPRAAPTCPKCQQRLPAPRPVETRRPRATCACASLTKAPRAAPDPVRRRPQRTGMRRPRGPAGRAGVVLREPRAGSEEEPETRARPASPKPGKRTSESASSEAGSITGRGSLPLADRQTSHRREESTSSELELEGGPSASSSSADVYMGESSSRPSTSREVFVGEWSVPGTSRHGLRSSDTEGVLGALLEDPRGGIRSVKKLSGEESRRKGSGAKSKKDIKNEENLQRASVSSQVEEGGFRELSAVDVSTEEASSKKRAKGTPSSGRHVCPVCSKAFGSPGKLGQHMYSHTGERPFECTQCSKAFSSKFKLVRHVLIHSDERRYRCTVCERTFHRKDHLKNHVKVHSPVKKTFHCEREGCGKEYSSFLSFRKHVAVHAAEEGNLECKMCGKIFATKDEIVYHLKIHAGSRTVKNPSDKKYRCDHCERKFFTRKDVRRHHVVHTGKRDFLCQFCPQRFGRKDHLVRHIKKSHHTAGGGAMTRGRGKRTRPSSTIVRDTEISSRKSATARTSVTKPGVSPHSRNPSLGGPSYVSHESIGEVVLLPGPSGSYSEVKESKDIVLLEERSQSEDPLKISGVEAILQHSPPSEGAVILKSEASHLPPVERSSVTVHHRPRTTATSGTEMLTGLVFGHPPSVPPPPYPTTPPELRSPFKAFEHAENIKLEFPSPGSSRLTPTEGGMDLSHFLSMMPSTSASVSHLSEGLVDVATGGVQEEIPISQELHRLLTAGEAGAEGHHLLVSDPSLSSQLLHLMESAATSLDIPDSSVAAATPTPSEMMASLLESADDVSASPTPLPRFNQAFHQQQPPP